MVFKKITEEPSLYRHLEKMSVREIISHINQEDQKVATAVHAVLPDVEKLIDAAVDLLCAEGRLFYIGAGTSGRLGILDASECPPTYGVSPGLVIGVIAGGNKALTVAVENAEDDKKQGWQDLQAFSVSKRDLVIGIASSGSTPYVMGALEKCAQQSIVTGSICCNPASPISAIVDFPIEVIVGPEFVTGSTRMKSGTATKMILNMISTAVMIQLGRVEDNTMVNMQLTNSKVIDRGTRMLMEKSGLTDPNKAKELLLQYGSVKKAAENLK